MQTVSASELWAFVAPILMLTSVICAGLVAFSLYSLLLLMYAVTS
jgi:hypothetical protein